MSDIGLTHIALPVGDLDESIAFYATYAAMQIVHRRKGVVWLSDKTRPFVVVLMETGSVSHPLHAPAHLGVGCGSREDNREDMQQRASLVGSLEEATVNSQGRKPLSLPKFLRIKSLVPDVNRQGVRGVSCTRARRFASLAHRLPCEQGTHPAWQVRGRTCIQRSL